MGLDQYGYAKTKDEVDDFFYWRKHNRLHGFMENLWKEKNPIVPSEEKFYGLVLDENDLTRLEKAVNEELLPKTTGFFFGGDSYGDLVQKEAFKQQDIEFIEKARQKLKEGCTVVYCSSW